MKSIKLLTALLATVPFAAACGSADSADDAQTLTFAAIPSESSQSLQSSYDNVIAMLEKETGVNIEFQDASDYAAVVEGQRAGQIDIASFGPFSYILAKDSGVPIEPVAAQADTDEGLPAYSSLAYVTADSDISSLEDLQGKKVCLVDPSSTSGYLVPTKGFIDAGMDVEADIEPVMTGGHDASLLALQDGACDAAFAHDSMLTTLNDSGQLSEDDVKPIWESDPITEDPVVLNTETVDAELLEQIGTTFREKINKPTLVEVGICESEDDCVLPEETEWGYMPVEDSDFNAIRDICEATQAEACDSIA